VFTAQELELSKWIMENKKRVEVLLKLSKSEKYFNELCIGSGSRSQVANALDGLLKKGIIGFEWTMVENKEKNPGKFGAVKMFHIKAEYLEVIKKLNL